MATRLACEGTNIRGFGSEVAHYHPLCSAPAGGVPVPGWFGCGADDGLATPALMRHEPPQPTSFSTVLKAGECTR